MTRYVGAIGSGYFSHGPTSNNLDPVPPANLSGGQQCLIDNVSFESICLYGQKLDKLITLSQPATLLTFQAIAKYPVDAAAIQAYFHLKPLNLKLQNDASDLQLAIGSTRKPFEDVDAICISQYLKDYGYDAPCPKLKFCSPITKFYVSFWGIDQVGRLLYGMNENTTPPVEMSTLAGMRIIASNGIDDLVVGNDDIQITSFGVG